jgi:hypothetical protein
LQAAVVAAVVMLPVAQLVVLDAQLLQLAVAAALNQLCHYLLLQITP